MDRQKVLEEVGEYFAESDHWRRLCATLSGETDPHGAHVHAYVDTSVDPYSLEAIITGYFERLGWPSSRKIDHLSVGPGSGSLHGIELEPQMDPRFDSRRGTPPRPLRPALGVSSSELGHVRVLGQRRVPGPFPCLKCFT